MARYLVFLLGLLMFSCAGKRPMVKLADQAPLYIYKSKLSNNTWVPITLTDDKKSVMSYPHPKDVQRDGELLTPIRLKDGFLLDRQGINKNMVFIHISYADYAKRNGPLPIDSMLMMIVEPDPIIELYQIGYWGDFDDPVKELNRILRKGQLEIKGSRIK